MGSRTEFKRRLDSAFLLQDRKKEGFGAFMISTNVKTDKEKAILVSLLLPDVPYAEQSLVELSHLADTAGVEVVGKIEQRKVAPDVRWYIGKGKVLEVRRLADDLGAEVVIFDQELSGAQVRNLEHMLELKIIDRTQLILDIFAQRAHTKEGQLQVELAQLNYLLPRLSGHGKHLSRLGAGIGTRGPGETKLETDRRHIRHRIRDIKRQLEQVIKHRELYRQRRHKSGIPQVVLAGYTNAGKSTLLNQLTGSNTISENKLFATLDSTTRKLKLPSGREVILTDTVGFIQNLPHDLIAAFKSTLEEVLEADLILHVVDASHPHREEQMRVVDQVLDQLGAHTKDRMIIYNKIDQCDPKEASFLADQDMQLKISAFQRRDLSKLKEALQNYLFGKMIAYRIPFHEGRLLATVYSLGEVVRHFTKDDFSYICIKTTKSEYERRGYLLKPFEVDQVICEEEIPNEIES